jgi:hypothetical protein
MITHALGSLNRPESHLVHLKPTMLRLPLHYGKSLDIANLLAEKLRALELHCRRITLPLSETSAMLSFACGTDSVEDSIHVSGFTVSHF